MTGFEVKATAVALKHYKKYSPFGTGKDYCEVNLGTENKPELHAVPLANLREISNTPPQPVVEQNKGFLVDNGLSARLQREAINQERAEQGVIFHVL